MRTEVDTMHLIHAHFNNNKQNNLYVPRINTPLLMDMLKLDSILDYETLPLNAWKIPEPDFIKSRQSALATGGLDLIILPGE